jgi:hypothetical protein
MVPKGAKFSRKELYDLVWSRPGRELAKEIGVSDVALSKACRKANIPRPGLGYWARKAFGKPVVQVALPPRGLGQSDEVRIGGRSWWYEHERETDEEIVQSPIPPAPTFPTDLGEVTKTAQAMIGRVRVPRGGPDRRHPIIRDLLEEEERRRERQKASAYSWDAPRFDSPMDQRRIRIFNALFIALDRCGCRPWLHAKEKLEGGVQVGAQRVAFALEPIPSSRRINAAKPSRVPRERLKLEISWWRLDPGIQLCWEDSEDAPLEKRLTEVGVGLLIAGEWSYRVNLEHRHQWRVERKRELQKQIEEARREAERQELERLRRIEEKRRKDLYDDVAAWKQAADIRSYANAVAADCRQAEDAATRERLRAWAAWALLEADRLDPMTRIGTGGTNSVLR